MILTPSPEEPDLSTSCALDVNAFVVKPVEFAGLIDAVKEPGGVRALINERPPHGVR